MILRQHKHYIPYIVGFIIVWITYRFITKPHPKPYYFCHSLNKVFSNYTWTYTDCPPLLEASAGSMPVPVWTDECLHKELSENVYGKPDLSAVMTKPLGATWRNTGRVKVPGLRDTCLPFPAEAFPKNDHHKTKPASGNRAHAAWDKENYMKFSPKFVKLAPSGWLYGVYAVHDKRVGPFSDLRVFGVSRLTVPGELFCQFSCTEHAHAVVYAPAKATGMRIDQTVDDSCFWQQFMFTCEVRANCTPGYVSLSKKTCGQVAGIIPVLKVDPPKQGVNPPHRLALCLSTISNKRDSDASYLVEYIETSRHFGIEKMFVYGTYNVSRRYRAVIDVYKSQGYIEVIHWDIPPEVNVVYKFAQLLQYTHCAYHNMAELRFLGLTQLEDLPFTTRHTKWKYLFDFLHSVRNLDNIASMRLEKREMCFEDLEKNKVPPDMTEKSGKPLDLRLVSQHAFGALHKEHMYIIQPRGIIVPHVYNTVVMVRGWQSMEINSANALVYSFNYQSRLCSNVDSRSHNDVTLCKQVPAITKTVIHALYLMDLINDGHRKISSLDQVCV